MTRKRYGFTGLTLELEREEQWENDETQVWWSVRDAQSNAWLGEIHEDGQYEETLDGYPSHDAVLNWASNHVAHRMTNDERVHAQLLQARRVVAMAERRVAHADAALQQAIAFVPLAQKDAEARVATLQATLTTLMQKLAAAQATLAEREGCDMTGQLLTIFAEARSRGE